ncbi:MAG TPA: LysR substrate-binding domain-containing protein [Kofleriaceae bacterium]|jgi:DNA-binding transcriptional LysR family regulator
MIDPSWDLYRTFLAVVDEGSLSAAARALALTQPTIGRHVEALEDALGLTLFVRSQRGLAATEAALALRPYAETIASTVAAMRREASSQGDAVRGIVRISASEIVGTEVLPPIVAALRARYPELELELALTNDVSNLLRQEADVAVRMTEPAQKALVVRKLGAVELGLFARGAYLDRHGAPKNGRELAQHTVIGVDRESAWVRAMRARIPGSANIRFALRATSDVAQLELIRAGAGIGIVQVPLAKRDDLVRVMPSALHLRLGVWLVMHENLRATPRCRAVFDALSDGVKRYLAAET